MMDRFIDTIEWLAAAFVGIVAVDIFISVLLRYFFAVSIPDSYDFGKLLLGILIFLGDRGNELPGRAYHCRFVVVGGGASGEAGDRRIRHFGLAVCRDGADDHAVRQGPADVSGQRADL
jgi:hypothetical protein